MSVLQHLQLQTIDPDDEMSDNPLNDWDEGIVLEDRPDEDKLEAFWDTVVHDIHEDPEWFTFSD